MIPVTISAGVTAALAALAATMNFLITPAGQKLVSDQEAIVTAILSHLGVHIAPTGAEAAAAPEAAPK